jgi:hypothetical protein
MIMGCGDKAYVNIINEWLYDLPIKDGNFTCYCKKELSGAEPGALITCSCGREYDILPEKCASMRLPGSSNSQSSKEASESL